MPSEKDEHARILHWREIHEIVKTVGSAGTFVAIVALVLTIRHEIPKIRTDVIPGVAAQLVAATHQEGQETRQTVKDVASDLSKKVDERFGILQTAVLEKVGKTEGDANDRVKDALGIVKEQVGRINDTLVQTQKSVDKAVGVVDPLKKTVEQVNTSLAKIDAQIVDPLTDCEDNPACFENRWTQISGAVEKTLNTVSDQAPKMASALQKNADNSANILKNVDGITADVHTFTTNFVHPPKKKWYQVLNQYLLAIAKIVGYVL